MSDLITAIYDIWLLLGTDIVLFGCAILGILLGATVIFKLRRF